ncbi:hypothetical protein F5882DRAFT_525151, partial [Hyaloscypha sp. PMI_1271]
MSRKELWALYGINSACGPCFATGVCRGVLRASGFVSGAEAVLRLSRSCGDAPNAVKNLHFLRRRASKDFPLTIFS